MNAIKEEFRKNGVVHVPNAISKSTLVKLEQFWQWCVDHPGPYAARLFEDRLVRAESLSEATEMETSENGFYYQDIGNREARPLLDSLVREPNIVDLVAQVFGTDDTTEGWFTSEQIFLKEENSPRTGWHQDISDAGIEGNDALVIWLSFDPVSQEKSLEVVRGSHLGPVYSSIYGTFESEDIPNIEDRREEFDIVSYECQPGDVILFHYGTLHGGGPTGPGDRRRSLALRFVGPDCRSSRTGKPARHKSFIKVL